MFSKKYYMITTVARDGFITTVIDTTPAIYVALNKVVILYSQRISKKEYDLFPNE